jgi:PAS domain S-box-containing protein
VRTSSKARQKRVSKVEELKLQLAEAVETIEAIRSGAVDALVVHGAQGEQIFTLKGADQVYRTLVEAMNEGAVSLNADQTILYCNNRFSEMVQTPLERIIGSPLTEFASSAQRPRLADFLQQSLSRRGICETVFMAAGAEVTVHLSANPLALENQTGVSLVITDITQRKLLETAHRELSKRIVTAQEQERHRVSRELHDSIQQLLSSARHRLHSIEQGLSETRTKPLALEARRTRELLERTIEEVRRISRALRPSELDDLGLIPALHSLVDEFENRTSTPVKIRTDANGRMLKKEAELAVYRIVQEAFMNIERHSKASRVDLLLMQTGDALKLRIKDNGQGFNSEHLPERGFGLANMQERAAQSGGRLWWKSAPGAGTEVFLALPF